MNESGERMKRVGVSEFRNMNAGYLRKLTEPLEICSKNQPVRVLVPYSLFLRWQELLRRAQKKERQ